MADCKKHHIKVLNPDVNESESNFTVNRNGDIRFGMGGMKGFGGNIVDAIVNERTERGLFADIYDFCERMSGTVNRKAMESLIYAGAFDSFGIGRSQYFLPGKSGDLFIDELMDYAAITRKNAEDDASSLFGDAEELKAEKPEPPVQVTEPDTLDLLKKEKDMVGMYLSEHPLKRYEFEMETFATCQLAELDSQINDCDRERTARKVSFAGFVIGIENKISKTGRPWMKVHMEDFSGTYALALFGKDCESFAQKLNEHTAIYVDGEIKESYRLKPEEATPEKLKSVPYKLKINNIRLLGNISDDLVSGFTMELSGADVNASLRKKLLTLVKGSKGNIPITMTIDDPASGYKVDFLSRKYKIALSSDFLYEIRNLGVGYKVSKRG